MVSWCSNPCAHEEMQVLLKVGTYPAGIKTGNMAQVGANMFCIFGALAILTWKAAMLIMQWEWWPLPK